MGLLRLGRLMEILRDFRQFGFGLFQEGRDASGIWLAWITECKPTIRRSPHQFFGCFGEWIGHGCTRGIGRAIAVHMTECRT